MLAIMSPEEPREVLSKDEWKRSLPEIVAIMSPAERLKLLFQAESKDGLRAILATMSPAARMEILSAEEVLQGLTPQQLEHLRHLLEQRRPADGQPCESEKIVRAP
jgi:hypothetical protein